MAAGAAVSAWWTRRTRVRAVLTRCAELWPFTPLGLALSLGAYAALRVFAYAQLDLVWLVTAYVALGLCALSPLFVIIGAIYVRWYARRIGAAEPLSLETGTPAQTTFALPSLRFLPFTQVRWQWLVPGDVELTHSRASGLAHEQVSFRDRGEHVEIVRRVHVEDPFGLSRLSFRLRQSCTSSVLPRLGALSHLPSLVSLSPGGELPHPMGLEDGDRLELQRYSPGDPARFIHWKVFARTRRLMVRKPERAVAIARRCAAFYVAAPNDDATAAVARLAITRELLGREWTFGTDLNSGVSRIDEALHALIASVRARGLSGRGLPGFLAQVEKRGPASVIVFASAQPGSWLEAVIASARTRQLRVVIGVDGVAPDKAPSFLARLFTIREASQGASSSALETVLTTLARAGVAVTLLDRATGRQLGEHERRVLLRAAKGLAATPAAARVRGAA